MGDTQTVQYGSTKHPKALEFPMWTGLQGELQVVQAFRETLWAYFPSTTHRNL